MWQNIFRTVCPRNRLVRAALSSLVRLIAESLDVLARKIGELRAG